MRGSQEQIEHRGGYFPWTADSGFHVLQSSVWVICANSEEL